MERLAGPLSLEFLQALERLAGPLSLQCLQELEHLLVVDVVARAVLRLEGLKPCLESLQLICVLQRRLQPPLQDEGRASGLALRAGPCVTRLLCGGCCGCRSSSPPAPLRHLGSRRLRPRVPADWLLR